MASRLRSLGIRTPFLLGLDGLRFNGDEILKVSGTKKVQAQVIGDMRDQWAKGLRPKRLQWSMVHVCMNALLHSSTSHTYTYFLLIYPCSCKGLSP